MRLRKVRKEVVREAIECIKRQKKIIAFEANIGRELKYRPPEMERRVVEYGLMVEAIEWLEGVIRDGEETRAEER